MFLTQKRSTWLTHEALVGVKWTCPKNLTSVVF
jgi:hypothetical protein